MKSPRMKDVTNEFPKAITKFSKPPLSIPTNENEGESDGLQGETMETIIPSNIIDIYTRLEILLGLNRSGETYNLTEASNLIDKL